VFVKERGKHGLLEHNIPGVLEIGTIILSGKKIVKHNQ
jgi:hypothetical protein